MKTSTSKISRLTSQILRTLPTYLADRDDAWETTLPASLLRDHPDDDVFVLAARAVDRLRGEWVLAAINDELHGPADDLWTRAQRALCWQAELEAARQRTTEPHSAPLTGAWGFGPRLPAADINACQRLS